MRTFGHLLVGAGTIGGVLAAAPTPASARGFAVSVLVLAAGLAMGQTGRRATPVAAPHAPPESIARALDDLRRLSAVAGTLSLDAIRATLDAIAEGPMFDAIRSLDDAPSGDPPAARFAARLAIAERHLNRCWSAAVDGAREETLDLLPRVVEALAAAAATPGQDGRPANN